MSFRFLKIVVLTSAFCLPQQVASQNDPVWHVDKPDSTLLFNKVIARQSAPIRNNPPNGYFRLAGKKLGDTIMSGEYVIVEAKFFPYFLGWQTWVKIKPTVGTGTPGWVYWGEEAVSDSVNFSLVESEETS